MMKPMPNIIITSNLGPYPDRRKIRLENHIKQREVLNETFPELWIQSFCSGYSNKELKQLKGMLTSYGGTINGSIVSVPNNMHKWQKHNTVFREQLYKKTKPRDTRAVLFLDDDVVPWDKKDVGIDPIKGIVSYLRDPLLMPYRCMYFSCAGLRFDAFYRNRKAIVKAPMQVVGWAILMRSDLGVFYDKDTFPPLDDFIFRSKCHAEGVEVGKFNSFFWKTLQRKEGESTLVDNHEERVAQRQLYLEQCLEKHPDLYKKIKGGKIRFRKRKTESYPGFF